MNDSENPLIDNINDNEYNYFNDFNKEMIDYERKRSTRINQSVLTIKIDKMIEQFKEYEKQRVARLYNFLYKKVEIYII